MDTEFVIMIDGRQNNPLSHIPGYITHAGAIYSKYLKSPYIYLSKLKYYISYVAIGNYDELMVLKSTSEFAMP